MSFDISKKSLGLFEHISISILPFLAHYMAVYGVINTKQFEKHSKSNFWVCGNEFLSFGNEFLGFGNEFPHFGGNEFRPKRTKKACVKADLVIKKHETTSVEPI